jgi:hypothetical protein
MVGNAPRFDRSRRQGKTAEDWPATFDAAFRMSAIVKTQHGKTQQVRGRERRVKTSGQLKAAGSIPTAAPRRADRPSREATTSTGLDDLLLLP